jgi:hypothetical protein
VDSISQSLTVCDLLDSALSTAVTTRTGNRYCVAAGSSIYIEKADLGLLLAFCGYGRPVFADSDELEFSQIARTRPKRKSVTYGAT